jgi:proline-specific peptidase
MIRILENQRIKVNGVELVYNDAGAGTTILTLHGGPGLGSRDNDWGSFLPFADTHRVISFDQRGNGESEGAEPYSHEQFVSDIEALRQQLDLGKIILTGGSYGGFIALEYALRYQQHLQAIILRDTAASNAFQGIAKQRALESGLPMDRVALDRLFDGNVKDDQEFRESFGMIQPLYNVDYDPVAGLKQLNAIPFRFETHNWAFSRNQPNYNIVARLPEIHVPTLVVVGRHDWITPLKASEEIAAGIPNSKLVIFEHSGHSPQTEERDTFLKTVDQFLAEVN